MLASRFYSCLDLGPILRFLRTQSPARFAQARRSEELDGRGTKPLGGKSQRVASLLIADNGHFLDVSTCSIRKLTSPQSPRRSQPLNPSRVTRARTLPSRSMASLVIWMIRS